MDFEIEEFFPKFIGKYRYGGDQQVVKDVCDRVLKEVPKGDDEWNDNVAEENLHHYFNISNSSLLRFDERLNDFEDFLLESSTHFFTEILEYDLNESNMLITDCWMNNCSTEHTWQIKHNHNNCMIVGTYFVDFDPKLHAPLDFYRNTYKDTIPSMSQMRQPRIANEGNKYTQEVHQSKPEEGMLFIWSAEMLHGYEAIYNLWKGRRTISMNFLPEIIDNGKYAFKIEPLQHISPTQLNRRKELNHNQ